MISERNPELILEQLFMQHNNKDTKCLTVCKFLQDGWDDGKVAGAL